MTTWRPVALDHARKLGSALATWDFNCPTLNAAQIINACVRLLAIKAPQLAVEKVAHQIDGGIPGHTGNGVVTAVGTTEAIAQKYS
jgi:hypothetical protein